MDLSTQYSVQVYRDEQGDGFVAVCPEFPSLSAFGDSREKAIEELQVVLELAVETYREEGWPLPDPKRPPAASLPSGEFRVRIPRSMHLQLAARAEEEGVSQNALVVSYVAHGLGHDQARQMFRETLARDFPPCWGGPPGAVSAVIEVGAARAQEFSISTARPAEAPAMSLASSETNSRDLSLRGAGRSADA